MTADTRLHRGPRVIQAGFIDCRPGGSFPMGPKSSGSYSTYFPGSYVGRDHGCTPDLWPWWSCLPASVSLFKMCHHGQTSVLLCMMSKQWLLTLQQVSLSLKYSHIVFAHAVSSHSLSGYITIYSVVLPRCFIDLLVPGSHIWLEKKDDSVMINWPKITTPFQRKRMCITWSVCL